MTTCVIDGGGRDSRIASISTAAAEMAFPGSPVLHFTNLERAIAGGPESGPAIMLISDASSADILQAVGAVDSAGLPRWAVVIFGEKTPVADVEAIGPSDCNAPFVARILRLSAARIILIRENAELRGDLLTIGLRVAHDLRTPLACIAASTEDLKGVIASNAPADLAQINAIEESNRELAEIIVQVSLIARATARPRVERNVQMGGVVWAALERLRSEITERAATISEAKSWPDVQGDESLLEAVWRNLISNSLRHSGSRPHIEIGWDAELPQLRFWIRDHGIGVPEPFRALLFQPFNQLHQPNALRGFGLALVQRLIHVQGGQCGYEAPSSGGSFFYFTLRAKPLAGIERSTI